MSRSEYSELPAIGAAIDHNSKSYDRIYGMLLGIRVHVSRMNSKPVEMTMKEKYFHEYEKIDIPREGNQIAPAHTGNYDYKFKAYQPKVYRALRNFFGVSDLEYLVSLTSDYMMSELKTIGRSSAMFYYTWDGRYVIKTLTQEEMKVLQRILPLYYDHVTNHPDTLVNQFYGAYRSQTSIGRKIHFVVMNNIFPIGYQIHLKFDLKGSVINRSVDAYKKAHPGSTWKEAEFSEKRYMHVGPRDWPLLKAQLLDDTRFLALAGVMDYSLLVGIHRFDGSSHVLHPAQGEKIELWTVFIPDKSSYFQYDGNSVIVRKREEEDGKRTKRHETEPTKTDVITVQDRFIPQAATLPYQAEDSTKLLSFCGGLRASNENDEPLSEIYFLGIIDFLQEYNTRKSAEHLFKSIVYKKDEMSCIPPDRYASRMFDYLVKTIGPSDNNPRTENEMLRRRRTLQQMATIPPTLRSSALTLSQERFSQERFSQEHLKDVENNKEDEEPQHKKKHKRGPLPPKIPKSTGTMKPVSSKLIDDLVKEDEIAYQEEQKKKKEEKKKKKQLERKARIENGENVEEMSTSSSWSSSSKKEAEEKKEEPKIEEKKIEPVVEEKKEESSSSSSSKKKEESSSSKKDKPRVEPVVQEKKEEPKIEEQKEESSSSSSSKKKEEPKVEERKEEPKVEEQKEESSSSSKKKEEPKVEEKKEEKKVEEKKEKPKTEEKKKEKEKSKDKKGSDDSSSLSSSSLTDSSLSGGSDFSDDDSGSASLSSSSSK